MAENRGTNTNWNTVLLIGGVAAAGGVAWWIYDKYFGGGGGDDYEQFIKHLATYNNMVDDYVAETQSLLAEVNTWFDTGEPLTAEQQQWLSDFENNLNNIKQPAIIKERETVIKYVPDPSSTPPDFFEELTDKVGIVVDAVVIGTVVIIGLYVFKVGSWVVTKFIKNWNDRNQGPPSTTMPTSGAVVTDIDLDALTQQVLEKIKAENTIDPSAINVAAPEAQALYDTLPSWIQARITSVAFDAAVMDGYALAWDPQRNWVSDMLANPNLVTYVAVATAVVAGIGIIAIAAPAAIPAIAGVGSRLAPVFVPI